MSTILIVIGLVFVLWIVFWVMGDSDTGDYAGKAKPSGKSSKFLADEITQLEQFDKELEEERRQDAIEKIMKQRENHIDTKEASKVLNYWLNKDDSQGK